MMIRLLTALLVILSTAGGVQAGLVLPPDASRVQGDWGTYGIYVVVRPGGSGDLMVEVWQTADGRDDCKSAIAGSPQVAVREATEGCSDPIVWDPWQPEWTCLTHTEGAFDDRCGRPQHYWIVQGATWPTAACHNGAYEIEARGQGYFFGAHPHCGEGSCDVADTLSASFVRQVQVNNLLINNTETNRVLVWNPDESTEPITIPVSLSDGGSLENTSITVSVLDWETGQPVKSIVQTVNGSTVVQWDGTTNGGQPAPRGLYTYTIYASHVEPGWACAPPPAVDCSTCNRSQPSGGSVDSAVCRSTMTVSCSVEQLTPGADLRTMPFRGMYQLNGPPNEDAAECGIDVYGPRLNKVLSMTDISRTVGQQHQVTLDVPYPTPGTYWFYVYARDAGTNSKGHQNKPNWACAKVSLNVLTLEMDWMQMLEQGYWQRSSNPAGTNVPAAVYVPLRRFAEALGFSVTWDAATGSAVVTSRSLNARIKPGSTTMTACGKHVEGIAAIIENGELKVSPKVIGTLMDAHWNRGGKWR